MFAGFFGFAQCLVNHSFQGTHIAKLKSVINDQCCVMYADVDGEDEDCSTYDINRYKSSQDTVRREERKIPTIVPQVNCLY